MTHVNHDRPEFVVAENAFRARHAGGPDAVIENPLQLSSVYCCTSGDVSEGTGGDI